MRRILATILLISGILLINSGFIMNNRVNKNTDEILDEFNKLSLSEIKEDNCKSSFDYSEIGHINPTKTFLDLGKIDKNSIKGQIVIPKSNINLVIFDGISENKLLAGVSTMKENQIMGENNYALAGHYGIKDELFHNIEKLENKDIIKITDKENIYFYEVYDKESVDPTRIDLVEDKEEYKDSPIISLMCCHYENGKNTGNRLFVKGKLVNVEKYNKEKMEAF